MSIAKGLAGGYMPLGAAVCTSAVWEPIRDVFGAFGTGHTFTAHTASCAAGVAVQKIMIREGLVAKVAANEPRIRAGLNQGLSGLDAVGDIRGRGHFLAVELVADQVTKVPFPADRKLFLKIRQQGLENGLICYPVGGNVNGIDGDIIILAPPYNASEAELDEITEKAARSIRQVLKAEGLA
jgi:adenosylmethionine-8-amino-7-oxononanoate aminotransferase